MTSPPHSPIAINARRLTDRLDRMAEVGATAGGGVNRLALTEADRDARDLLIAWMRELGMRVSIDAIGNIIGVRDGDQALPEVMTGSHIDSVASGGRFDGTLGVLAGLEVVQSLNDSGISTRHPIAVASFTNEEGARFAPDMLGSAVHQGSLALAAALEAADADGQRLGDCLDAIGYRGDAPVASGHPHAYIELHIEQGPVLEQEGVIIGAVDSVQGISWTEYTIEGVANHAGTTPMALRHDAGYAAAAIATGARAIATDLGGAQVATVGAIKLEPNLVNVVARRAQVTVDLRNVDNQLLVDAESQMQDVVNQIAANEGVTIESRSLARFEPVAFSRDIVACVTKWAKALRHSVMQMPSGAGHDAQMFAPWCPTGMIFVPSRNGISHNVNEFTEQPHIEAGANVLANVMLELAVAT